MITLFNITKFFKLTNNKKHYVLNNVSYSFEDGVSTSILGLNGTGKTTLLKLLCGSSYPNQGKIVRTSSVSWPIGFAGFIVGSLSGYQNLKFISKIYKSDYRRDKKFVEDFTELGDYLNEPVKTYSSGMKAKLNFALSMSIGFDFYLVDEAFSVGDATFRKKGEELFKEKTKNSTVIMVTHNVANIPSYFKKALVLDNGKLISHSSIQLSVEHYLQLGQGNNNGNN